MLLASSSTLRSILGRVNSEIADVVEGITAGDADRLADIGITFNDFPGDEETPFVRNILNQTMRAAKKLYHLMY